MSMNADRTPPGRDARDRVRVGVAEFAVATGDTLLATSGLGSCVGVALADPGRGVAGLAHVMLPETPENRTDDDPASPAKFATTGVERLLAAVEDAGGDREAIEAKLAGGSRMFDFTGVSEAVGRRNVDATRAALSDGDVPVVAEDVGGSHGRSLVVDPASWTLTVTSTHDGEVVL
ncbi:chemotaxis protein CheD [Halorussus halobius]|uniref:chemotaxis protein CheD n=1 Tax=Halorussus halobius TaxID=1710537 RepID=UPI001B2FF577|nr:chemotaxis protein CheD [Halorussus halobius]